MRVGYLATDKPNPTKRKGALHYSEMHYFFVRSYFVRPFIMIFKRSQRERLKIYDMHDLSLSITYF